jgi:hypothetical protein
MEPDVRATFELSGRTFEDVNPVCRGGRMSGPTIAGVRPGNANRWTMHAEFGAMFQAYEEGLRGGHGQLTISGLIACPWCKGDVKTLARKLQLESLTVTDADGTVVRFESPADFLPVRQGGKTWN